MKKLLSSLCLLLALSFCVVLTSCGGKVEDISGGKYVIDFSQSQKRKVELRVWMDDTDGVVGRALEADFEELHPDINLVFQHMATVDAREKLKTYGQSGNGADIFQFPHDHMAQAILDDLVYALPSEMLSDVSTRLNPVALDIATISYNDQTHEFDPNGEQTLYAVPVSLESVALYYNIDILQALWGAEWEKHIPTTFTDFFADMEAYAAMTEDQKKYTPSNKTEEIAMSEAYFANSSHWADQYFIQFIYSAFGFRPFGENGNDDTAVGFEKESVTKALTWMTTELKPRIASTNHNSIAGQNLFETGKLPFVLTGPWAIPGFRSNNINFGVVTLPTINVDGEEKTTSTFAGAQMFAGYKYSKHKEQVITFLEYMSTARAQQIIYNLGGDLPALNEAELTKIEGLSENQALKATIEQLATSIPMPTIPAVTYYWGPGETMVTNIWNSAADIVEQQKTAEDSYAAKKNSAK